MSKHNTLPPNHFNILKALSTLGIFILILHILCWQQVRCLVSVTTSMRSHGATNVVFGLDLLRGHFIYFIFYFVHLFYIECMLIIINDEHTLVLSCTIGQVGSFGGRSDEPTSHDGGLHHV